MSRNVDQVDVEVGNALKVDSGPQGTVNLLCMVALDFADFVQICAKDVEEAALYNLPVSDPRSSGYDSPGGRALGVMAYRKDAFGPGLDEYVMDKLKAYTPTCNVEDLHSIARSMRAYSQLAGRVARYADSTDDIARIEEAAYSALSRMRALDADMWHIFRETGKQHLNGVEAALADVDGHSWTDGKVYKGQCEHTRNDPSAQVYVKNGKAMHAYVAARGSVSERDMLAS